MRLVQLTHPERGRSVAVVDEPQLLLLDVGSVYGIVQSSLAQQCTPIELARTLQTSERLDYDEVYAGGSPWQLLPAFDHPADPHRCLVTGTGLTHLASAENRNKMHEAQAAGDETDSMRIYRWGVEGGRPEPGQVGQQPEWFYKGTGHVLRGHGQLLQRPWFADDAGEEPEVAGVYVVDGEGRPWRIGFAPGNEFADHAMEKKNYLNLAHSKLRQCAIGPELSLNETFEDLTGTVSIMRDGTEVWSSAIQSGAKHMAHSLENLEHHHFKYAEHRLPGQAHIHFFGAAAFSFGAGVELQDGDQMCVAWQQLGRALLNPLTSDSQAASPIAVEQFGHEPS